MAVLGLRFCTRAFSSCGKRGPLFIAVRGPLTIVASLVAEHRLQTRRLSNVAHGPGCSAACGIFPDQGSNPCPLHWQADSQPLRHQGSPRYLFISVGSVECWDLNPSLSASKFHAFPTGLCCLEFSNMRADTGPTLPGA